MSLNAALKAQHQHGPPSRRRTVSKGQKRLQTAYAEEFEEKHIPFEKEHIPFEKTEPEIDDLDWFLGNGSSSSSSTEKRSSQKWQRLHHGLKPRQSLEEAFSPSDLAARKSGLDTMLQVTSPSAGSRSSQPRLTLKQLLQQDITPAELDAEAEPLKPIQISNFPPVNSRPDKPVKPKQNHYQFFASICPSEEVDRRKIVEQRQVTAGKTVSTRWPKLNHQALYRQSSRLFNSTNGSRGTILGRGAGKLANAEKENAANMSAAQGTSGSKEQIPKLQSLAPTSKKGGPLQFLKRSSSKDLQRSSQLVSSPQKSTLSPAKKGSCRALRLIIFGKVGDESAKNQKEADMIFEEERGAHQEVVRFYQAWKELDADFSGEVSFRELLEFGRWRGLTPLHERALKAVLNADAIDERYKQVQMHELMTLIWPKSQIEDRVWMKEQIDIMSGRQETEEEPLPEELIDDFKAKFASIQDGSGGVTVKDLVNSGLATEEDAMESLRRTKIFLSDDGKFGLEEFLQIMCPKGYSVP